MPASGAFKAGSATREAKQRRDVPLFQQPEIDK